MVLVLFDNSSELTDEALDQAAARFYTCCHSLRGAVGDSSLARDSVEQLVRVGLTQE